MTLKEFFKRDRFAASVGAELVEAGDGRAVARLELEQRHLNGVDIVQGGVLFTLADLAFAAAANSRGKISVSINTSINFLSAVSSGTLIAEASEVSLHRRVGVYRVSITHQQSGTLLATYEGTVFRKDDDLPL